MENYCLQRMARKANIWAETWQRGESEPHHVDTGKDVCRERRQRVQRLWEGTTLGGVMEAASTAEMAWPRRWGGGRRKTIEKTLSSCLSLFLLWDRKSRVGYKQMNSIVLFSVSWTPVAGVWGRPVEERGPQRKSGRPVKVWKYPRRKTVVTWGFGQRSLSK